MIQYSKEAEESAILSVAQKMCAAARTAPKTKGEDYLVTCILTGKEKDELANMMEQLSQPLSYGFFCRDASNVRDSHAVVLLGIKNKVRNLNKGCGYCGFEDCSACAEAGGMCAYGPMDLGIAIGSAVTIAAEAGIDNRVMFSAGRSAMALGVLGEDVRDVIGIPLSAKGKSPYFDRRK